jgi:hypothetical protein
MTGQKLREAERWKGRRKPQPQAPAPIALMPSPPSTKPLAAADRARIARWMASRIVSWPPDNCFCCKRPIIFGAKWTELVNDNDRARFHFDCAPMWKLQQQTAARRALGLVKERRTHDDAVKGELK